MAGTVCMIGLLLLGGAAACVVNITDDITIHMNHVVSVPFTLYSINSSKQLSLVTIVTADDDIAKSSFHLVVQNKTYFEGVLNIDGVFLGRTNLIFTVVENEKEVSKKEVSHITVIREERVIDTVFTASVAILVSLLFINFGCAIDWNVCYSTLKKPIGPSIGFLCQFLIMPLLSFLLGYLLFPAHPELQIGLFFTGISPSGGASNVWTVLLDGNLNLSVTMTTLCTIAAFGMMPFWIFTLGKYIFSQGGLTVPYRQIGTFVIGLVIPLFIGFVIQKKLPRISRILIRIMKPFSVILILFIIIFATVTNLYLFQLFSWKIVLAGMGLPWLGFMFGFIAAKIFKQPQADIRAIAIETGIQNTGVSIFLLRFTLKPPIDDLTTVIPVSIAIMTPIPLVILYIIKLIYQYIQRSKATVTLSPIPSLEKLQETTNISNVRQPKESGSNGHTE